MQATNILLSDTLFYNNEQVLSYKINYPQFITSNCTSFIGKLNNYYKENALKFEKYCRDTLFPETVEQYKYAKENNYPIIPYEAVMNYNITYLTDCYISLYFDKYIFTGGAHGNTTRFSDTWDVCKGCIMQLSDFFPHNPNFKDDIITFIIDDISERLKNPNLQGTYFDTYKQDVHNTFHEGNFYMTPNGIVVFFQQYDIAPYSSGIQEFLIPYCS
ncbi:DUF3298 and DUF4163 domain-containing protein [Lachnoclostridium phytofermentans]|uniref:DUF3298/DUF4163 domain-containing protein n=1 Tax=Lachnoclostridium phytofermentans (strain ATCC 700394 / DSM 18823 / ISDg) TaxID=357809 RepID=A9KRU7_LACP7|nr:DUF3298 and DUF4163 domain-containing protein [Lachnoclostridium phytofermentans]ABX43591.1 conserved hypothetical protein [Lachnoclostridium phytofermentans ISDg]